MSKNALLASTFTPGGDFFVPGADSTWPFGRPWHIWASELAPLSVGESVLMVTVLALFGAAFLFALGQIDGIGPLTTWSAAMLTPYPYIPVGLTLFVAPWRTWLVWVSLAVGSSDGSDSW